MLSFGRRKSARAGIRAALLSGATVAVVGLGAVGSASASPVCTGNVIKGEGSSLQGAAQGVWVPGFNAEPGCSGLIESYVASGSGTGLAKWNSNGVSGTIDHTRQYIGTDDGPSVEQIGNINAPTAANGAGLLTIPVAQTAIAVIADPPAGCELGEAGEPGFITNKDLEGVFNGSILKWSQLSTVLANPNPACNHKIERVVRKDASGTTYQFKNYLWLLNKKGLPCTTGPTEGRSTWQELETNGPGGQPNLTWPEDEGCAVTASPVRRPTANGGGAVAEEVIKTPGTIGYAALPDAKSKLASCVECHEGQILELQDNGKKKLSEATFANAEVVGGEKEANCQHSLYSVPSLARRSNVATHGVNSDWSKVFGAKIDTTASGSGYPLCTLTYDLAFNHYETAGFTEAEKVVTTVKAFLNEYIVQTAGQNAMGANHYYAKLPTGTSVAYNVLDAAQFAAGKIGK